jgi:endonuclease/exonuclease/phosphatase family metal-dependent hydrolase
MSVSKLRILTLNIAHGRGLSLYQGLHRAKAIEHNLSKIAYLLKRISPDIAALQEVDEDSHWNKRIDLLEYLQEAGDFGYRQMGINTLREGRMPLAYGNGVLSQLPIEHSDNQAFGNATLGEKGFLYTEHTLPSGHLPVVNLHLDYKSRLRRIEQVERLIEYLDERHREKGQETYFSPIICGDFNSRDRKPSDAVLHLFRYLQNQCDYQLFPAGGRTFPSLMPIHGLDFIFVPPQFRVRRSMVLRAYVSDHCPVLIDLEINH